MSKKEEVVLATRFFAAFFCAFISYVASAANSINLPPSATPGAVEPERIKPHVQPKREDQYYLFDLIPSKDKTPKGDEGESTYVRSIILQGVTEQPKAGVHLQGIRQEVEKYRTRGKKASVPSGEVANTPHSRNSNVVTVNRELTLGLLESIARDITNYYRARGFILAQAYVPEQKVVNGDVVVKILEGKLGHVEVEGNELYGRRILLKPFGKEIGQPVYKPSLETALLRLTDYPGLSVFGVFRPGKEVGSTDLVVKVKNERRYDGNIQLDNFGSKFTGAYRLRGNISVNNLTGAADTLDASLLQTFDPSNGIYGAVDYERPLSNVRDSIGVGYSRNTYDIGGALAASGISGTSEITNLFWRRSFLRGIHLNGFGLLAFARKDSTLSAPIDTTDKLSIFSGEYDFNTLSTDFTKVNVGFVKFSQGIGGLLGAMQSSDDPNASRLGGSGKHAGGNFSKLEFRYSHLQRFGVKQTLTFTLSGQYSKDLLSSMEQMPLGGPTSVRAYPISEFLVDSGYFGSLEWAVKAPGLANSHAYGHYTWGDILQLAVFADVAGGSLNDPLPTDRSSVNISGVGVGLRLNSERFSAHLDFAKPVSSVSGQNVKDIQAYINIISKI